VVQQDIPVTLHVAPGQATPLAFDLTCRVLPVIDDVILFSSDRHTTAGRPHLFRMKPDGTGAVDLTGPFDGRQGRISPGGTKIVFSSHRGGNDAIYLMDVDGSHAQQLSQGGNPAWSPDGQRIAFEQGGNVWVMNRDGTHQTRLTQDSGSEPAWSPDGQRIAYTKLVKLCNFDPCAYHILIAPASGGAGVDISANGDKFDRHPAWSPDGGLIAYDEDLELWAVRPDGTGNTKLSRDGRADVGAVWSPDGSKIAFTRFGPQSQIYVMNADGSGATNLSHSSHNDEVTSWR